MPAAFDYRTQTFNKYSSKFNVSIQTTSIFEIRLMRAKNNICAN